MSAIEKALKIKAERSKEYPDYVEEAHCVCEMANAALGTSLTPKQYTVILICMKLCREGSKHKEDNVHDLINYASFLQDIHEAG